MRSFFRAGIEDSRTKTKLVKTAVRIMVNDWGAARAVVLLSNEPHTAPAAQYGFDLGYGGDPKVNQPALEAALTQKKSILVLNSLSDPTHMAPKAHCSILCAPLPTGGALYCDHPEPGKFDYSTLKAMEKLAEDFQRQKDDLRNGNRAPISLEATWKKNPILRSSAAALLLLVGVMIAAGVAVLAAWG